MCFLNVWIIVLYSGTVDVYESIKKSVKTFKVTTFVVIFIDSKSLFKFHFSNHNFKNLYLRKHLLSGNYKRDSHELRIANCNIDIYMPEKTTYVRESSTCIYTCSSIYCVLQRAIVASLRLFCFLRFTLINIQWTECATNNVAKFFNWNFSRARRTTFPTCWSRSSPD